MESLQGWNPGSLNPGSSAWSVALMPAHSRAQDPGPRVATSPQRTRGRPVPSPPPWAAPPQLPAHRLFALFQHAWPHGALPPSPGPAQPGGRVPGRHLLLLRRVHQQVSALSPGRAWVGHALSRGGVCTQLAGREGGVASTGAAPSASAKPPYSLVPGPKPRM